MRKIGIIGYGFVGKAVEYGFKADNEIFIYDISIPSSSLEKVVREAEFIFICVPTPMTKEYTEIDLSVIDEAFKKTVELAKRLKRKPVLVIKSTVVPGTTKKLAQKYRWPKTLFNPEFLVQANFLEDFVKADRIIVGGANVSARRAVVGVYRSTFPQIPIFETDPTTAEMVKYMANTFLATKVVFANEMWEMCRKLGINYDEVRKMVVADKRIYDSHLKVTAERGFGGKCLPKDTVAFLGLAKELGVDLAVLKAVWKKNLQIRKVRDRDWEKIPGAVSRKPHRR